MSPDSARGSPLRKPSIRPHTRVYVASQVLQIDRLVCRQLVRQQFADFSWYFQRYWPVKISTTRGDTRTAGDLARENPIITASTALELCSFDCPCNCRSNDVEMSSRPLVIFAENGIFSPFPKWPLLLNTFASPSWQTVWPSSSTRHRRISAFCHQLKRAYYFV